MTKRPLFLAGCIYLVMTAVSFYALKAAIGLTLLSVVMLLLLLWKQKKGKALLIGTAASVLACISVLCWQQRAEAQLELVGEPVLLEGLITDCRVFDSALLYEAKVPMQGRDMTLTLWSYDMEPIPAGNRFEALADLEEENHRYWSDGSILTAQVQNMVDLGMESSLQADCLRLRDLVKSCIESLFHGKGEEILLGLLLGDKAELSDGVKDVFLKSGSLHLLTVSGFHFSMMAAGLFACFQLLQFNPKLCAAFSLPFLMVLLLMEGATISVQRAAVMTTLAFLAMILERDNDGLNSWGAALLVVLLPEPLRMFSESFLLSFSAVLGILLIAAILRKEGTRLLAVTREGSCSYRILSRAIDIIAVSLSANMLTAPFLLYFFGNLPLLAPLSSLIVMPLLPPIMITAVAAILLPFAGISKLFAAAAQLLCALLFRLLSWIANLDSVYYGENNLLLFGLLFFYVFLLLLYVFRAGKRQVLCLSSAYLLLLTTAMGVQTLLYPTATELYVCRSSLLLCREGRAVLIGAPERKRDIEEWEQILRSQKAEALDLLYLTNNEEMDEVQLLEFCETWAPNHIVSAAELNAMELKNINYRYAPEESIRFWDHWQLGFTENGALLSNGERKFLKLHEKYAIMSMYRPEYTAILGDDQMIYGDGSVKCSRSWSGALKFTLEDGHDSGTGKPAAGTNQRG
ncbi:MAG: ComEC/Rec2 family competence protein [Oscillospiraceae bacterium]|nr:ComEC/Rec2 family competence protein [Oscillospiraceae bacterium]